MTTSSSLPLDGVRVVDLSTTFSGPYCTLLLAEMGAAVTKVESPEGDITRHLGPARSAGMASVFLALNRGKRSVVVDLKTDEGRSSWGQLVDDADVVIHNMRPGAARRLAVDAATVLARNPAVVHCAIHGYAADSPAADRPAYDDIIQGDSGLAAIQGHLAGQPQYVATIVADKTVGLMALSAIVAGLYRRERTGVGESIEVPMLDTMVSYTLMEHLAGATFEPALGPVLYARTTSPHRRPYRTADSWICVLVYTEDHWRRFLHHIGRAQLLEDDRYRDVASRMANIDDLYAMVSDVLARRTTDEWLRVFEDIDVPAARVRTPDEVMADREGVLGGLVSLTDHPTEGPLRTLAHPVKYGGRRPPPASHAPSLGADTKDVLGDARSLHGDGW